MTAEEFKDAWNTITSAPIPRCRELTPKRIKHLHKRLAERSDEDWYLVLDMIDASSFCRGKNDRGWMASFDWLIGSPDVAVKVLEGKYNDRTPSKQPSYETAYGWACPHDPKCEAGTSAFRCHQRSILEASRGEPR